MESRTTGGIPLALLVLACAIVSPVAGAADHGDAPLMASDVGADIADIYFFLDPNDNSRVILVQTQRGFIVPGEAENLTVFDPQINYRLAVNRDAPPDPDSDIDLNVRFSPRVDFQLPQIATITIVGLDAGPAAFEAPTTVSSSTARRAPAPVITADPDTGIRFFAGMTDDPFFFDVPAELLYRDSRFAGETDPSAFRRRRDTFAGYNVLAIALSVPVELLLRQGAASAILGFSGYTERAAMTERSRAGGPVDSGMFVNVDRMGIPGINTILVPYEKRDAYNRSTTSLDPLHAPPPLGGLFGGDIVATLQALQTDPVSIAMLADLAVNSGDYLRLDTSIANTGRGGGINPNAGFPNGRRLTDDVIDVVVTVINNGMPVRPNGAVDGVNGNEKRFRNRFPFLAAPHQPLPGNRRDPTQN